jgi:uncharacterized membrane protein YphA (DoxX/SURF4 family)
MDEVGIHCYRCPAVVGVDSRAPEEGLRAAGWSLDHGETYCSQCAEHGASPPPVRGGSPADAGSPSRELALLDALEGRARRDICLGVVAIVLGLALLAGLSTNPVAVAVAALTVIGLPMSRFWDDRTQRQTKQAIGILVALMVFWLVVQPLSHGWGAADVGRLLRWVLLISGPAYIWAGLRPVRFVPLARSTLGGPIYDVHLEVRIRRGYGGIPYTEARLWPADPELLPGAGQVAHPLARFSWQASEPPLLALAAVPAIVHGAPTNRAAVVVSCEEAVLVGRVKSSHFGESPALPRPMSPLMAFLWKPRTFRLR